MDNKRAKRQKLRDAVNESEKVVPCYTRNYDKSPKHHFVEWDVQIPEELDAWVADIHDDVVRYTMLHQNADIFESTESYTEIGENFAAWAQRRIAEMRGVKESRIRRSPTPLRKPAIWKDVKDATLIGRADGYDVFTGDATTTTLPTNEDDARGHKLLKSILAPSGKAGLRRIDGYEWFGEYEWAWHRNISGCWELGYADCTKREGCWEFEPIPCPHCCAESWGMFFGCYCRDFGSEPAPDEVQRCALVEWVDMAGQDIILEEEVAEGARMPKSCHDAEVEVDSEWEVVSVETSDSWSVVDANL